MNPQMMASWFLKSWRVFASSAAASSGSVAKTRDLVEKRVHEIGVAPAALYFAPELCNGPLDRESRSVRPLRRERIEHVDNAHDLREQRDRVAPQSVRVAAAVKPFVVMADDRPYSPQEAQLAAEPIADHCVLLHQLVFVRRERPRLQEDRIGDADLPEVVKKAAARERRDVVLVEIQRAATISTDPMATASSVIASQGVSSPRRRSSQESAR